MRWILVLMGIVGVALQLPTSAPAAEGPHALHRIGTRNTGKIDGTALMWDFFVAHQR